MLAPCLDTELGDLRLCRQASKVHSDGRLPLRELSHLGLPVAHAFRLQLDLGGKAALAGRGSASSVRKLTKSLPGHTCAATAVASTALSCSRRMLWSLWLFSAARLAWILLFEDSSN